MNFTRTDSGISNMALFEGVDFVVFIEGGATSYCLQEATSGLCNTESIDITFWKSIFKKYCQYSVAFKPIGSKSTLIEIANKISTNNLNNVCVAFDRDYDNFSNNKLNCNNIIYTYGYSWENDVWQMPSILGALEHTCRTSKLPENLINAVIKSYCDFKKDIHKYIYLDIVFRQNGLSFLPRNTGDEFIANGEGNAPIFSKTRGKMLLRSIKALRDKPIFRAINFEINPLIDGYGKLISTFGYRVLSWAIKILGIAKVAPRDVTTSWILTFFSLSDLSGIMPETHAYYERCFLRLQP